MRKALPITIILLLLTLSLTPFATAQQQNIITNATNETLYVISSTKFGAENDIPAGYRTSGWKTIAAGDERGFWAYDPHKIYFLIFKGSQPIKPQRSTGTFAFWINRNANFDIVTRQEINASITRGQLLYSSHGTNPLTHRDGFMRYDNGSRITVTDAWVDVDVETVDPNAPVNIPDVNLRAAIEAALGKSQGATISQTDMLTLTSLDISDTYTEDLTGLEFGKNLRQLNLSLNWIEDISPLANLTRLTTLNLEGVPIENVSRLANLTRLTTLNLTNVLIGDVSGLANLTNLTSLNLSFNSIEDVSGLANLTNLTSLNLFQNSIEDISPLAGLTNLTSLNLAQNTISNILPLAGLTNLTSLDLSENFISDVSPLASLTNLRALYLFYNLISDFSPIADLIPNLETYRSHNQSLPAVAVDPDAPVNIPDPVLRAAIENELAKSPGTRITQAEMATLTSFSFDSSEVSIQDLTGLEFAVNLTKLHVPSNRISDVSALAGLKNLMWLDLSSNLILEVSALAGLNNLIWLDLSTNPYTYTIGAEGLNIVPIAQLQNLTYLDLRATLISDVAPIAQLKNLSSLYLSRNAISDISPIAGLKGLEKLQLSSNLILDVSPLADLKNLTLLGLGGNVISDISPLSDLTNLITLSLDVNQISDISPLARLENLTTLYISDNQISDFSPIAHLIPNLETYENNNQTPSTTVGDPGAPVNISDPKLRTAIEIELRKSPGATITQAEISKLSRLHAQDSRIQDLTGLEFAINLKALNLTHNQISEISALAALKNLEVLYLSDNQIEDVSPLAGLESLTDLYLSYNWIRDFSPIAGLIPNLGTYENSNQDPLAVAADPEAPVAIPDPVLRAAIESELGKSPGTTITQAEMATLLSFDSQESAGIQDIADPGIQDLTGLEFAINLQTLELDWLLHIPTNTYRPNRLISDVSALANLENLTALHLSGNGISDISALANLENLTVLYLSNNQISGVAPLTGLKNLTDLDLSYNHIPDTSALSSVLANLENLKRLRLSWLRKRISDVSFLADLENLVSLDLSGNQISDVAPLANLEIWDLYLSNNQISDVSPLVDLENLASLDLSNNRISDVAPLANLENLRRLYLSDNRISDVSPLAALKNLLELKLTANHISDFSSIADLIPNLSIYENSNQVSLTAAVDPEAPVHIRDSTLRTAIENELGKRPGATITQAEMAQLTSLSPFGIRDLTGLEFAINLRALYLWDNEISDVSALTALVNLEELALGRGQLSDVSSLAALENLEVLALTENQISDVSPLAALNNLTSLYLSNNQIGDISALAALENLTELQLSTNQLSDVSSLAALANLEVLTLSENQISDISALTALENLTALYLSENQISDVAPLANLHDLTALYLSENQISDVAPLANLHDLTALYLSENQISDIAPLANLHDLTALYLSHNQISDVAPLANLHDLTALYLSHNQISDVAPLANLHNLTKLYLSHNRISDASPLTALENLTAVDVALVPFCLTLDPPKRSKYLPPGVPIFPLAGSTSNIWTKDDTIYEEQLSDDVVLTVKFLDGTSYQHGEVEKYAALWEPHGAVRFKFTTTGTSDINIHFDSGEDKALIGSPGVYDAREGEPTMWLTTIDKQTILHEFGHALGFVHEHQTPAGSNLDIDKILANARARYEEKGLSEEDILEKLEANYIRLDAGDNTNNFSEYDPDSVMLYGGLALIGGGETKWNDDLSALDKKYMGIFYPKPDPSVASIRVRGIDDDESIKSGTTRTLEATVHASDGSRIPDKGVVFSFSHGEDDEFASAVFTHTLAHTDPSGGAAKTDVTFTGQNDHVIISVKAAGTSLTREFKIYVEGKPPQALTQEINFVKKPNHRLWGGEQDWHEVVYVDPPIHGARVTITKVEVSGKAVNRSRIKWWNPFCFCWNYGSWGSAGVYKNQTTIYNGTAPDDRSRVVIEGWLEEGLLEYASAKVTGTIYYEYVAAAPSAWEDSPQVTALLPNYPNPFNPETWIPYHLAKPADVTLTIYAINGQVVRRLDLGYQAAGFYRSRARAAYWDGRNSVGERVASGLYFYTLTAGEFAATRKMLIMK